MKCFNRSCIVETFETRRGGVVFFQAINPPNPLFFPSNFANSLSMLIKFAISLGVRPRAVQPDVERGVNLCNASCTIQNGKQAADREKITVTGLIIL